MNLKKYIKQRTGCILDQVVYENSLDHKTCYISGKCGLTH